MNIIKNLTKILDVEQSILGHDRPAAEATDSTYTTTVPSNPTLEDLRGAAKTALAKIRTPVTATATEVDDHVVLTFTAGPPTSPQDEPTAEEHAQDVPTPQEPVASPTEPPSDEGQATEPQPT